LKKTSKKRILVFGNPKKVVKNEKLELRKWAYVHYFTLIMKRFNSNLMLKEK
jgi:hypothetical protein